MGRPIQALRPGVAQRIASLAASSTNAAALLATTRVVRIKPIADTYVAIGPSPTATTDGTSTRLDATDGPEYFSVLEGDVVAFRQVSGNGDVELTEMA